MGIRLLQQKTNLQGVIMSNTTIKPNLQVSKKQYKHASQTLRANGWSYSINFFQNYPERIVLLSLLDDQRRDPLEDKIYLLDNGFNMEQIYSAKLSAFKRNKRKLNRINDKLTKGNYVQAN